MDIIFIIKLNVDFLILIIAERSDQQ